MASRKPLVCRVRVSKMVEVFECYGVSFVSVTQQFNTTTSMGRLMLNILLSFAQFEREVTGERIRDKIADGGLEIIWRDHGWQELAGELLPGTIGVELQEWEQQDVEA